MKRLHRIVSEFLRFSSRKDRAQPGVVGWGNAGIPEDVRSQLDQAHAELKRGHPAEALKRTRQAISTGVTVRGLHFLHGLCLSRVGRHDEALKAFEEELALHPDHGRARKHHDSLAKALARPRPVQPDGAGRSWHTSLPQVTLKSIQNALHHYTYRGVPMLKNPFDLALYPRLIWQLKPCTIFEIGSKSGGSGLWLGDLVCSFGLDTRIYSLDIVRVQTVHHPRLTFLEGDGRALGQTLSDDFLGELPRPWLVIEDADHAYETSIATLRFFHPWLESGEYIITEDGIISDLVQDPASISGPHQALKEFLRDHGEEYQIDGDYCDFFGYNVTWCTNGFLKKISKRVS